MRGPTLDELYEELSPGLSDTDDEERERMEKVMSKITWERMKQNIKNFAAEQGLGIEEENKHVP